MADRGIDPAGLATRREAPGTYPDSRAAVPCEQPDPKMDAQNFTFTFTGFYKPVINKDITHAGVLSNRPSV